MGAQKKLQPQITLMTQIENGGSVRFSMSGHALTARR
jgi:hypothetical protein